jgi:hypothetical protein
MKRMRNNLSARRKQQEKLTLNQKMVAVFPIEISADFTKLQSVILQNLDYLFITAQEWVKACLRIGLAFICILIKDHKY